MLATCTPLGRGALGVGARAAGLHEGTRLASPRSPRSPQLLGRRQGAWRRQGRVLAFKEEEQEKEEGAVKQGAGGGAVEAGPAGASVTFKTCCHIGFGQVLKVVGGLPQLGDWDCKQAPAMTWSEGDMWLLQLDLPAGKHEFKVVVDKGSAGTEWEAGGNRTLQVPAPEASAHGAFTIVCEWGNTVSSLETLPEEELEGQGPLSDSEADVPALRPEDLTAEPYSPNGDEGEAPVGVVGKMTMEGGPGSKKAQQMGEGSDAALGGVPAGGLKPSTEAAVKKDLQKRALSGDEGDEEEGSDNDDYGSGGSGTGGAAGKQATPAQQQGQQQDEPPPPSASAFTLPALPAPSDPPSGLQLAASAAGLVALPVVAWSEWVLKSTGCGLPPGPSGLLGAAEGVSYLVVGAIVLWSLSRKLGTGQGLPPGPAGALGAVEGGSWLAVLSGLAVLGLQWQTYGYIPSALPDSNCFGADAPAPGYNLAQAPKSGTGAPAAAPALTNAGSQAARGFGALRLPAGGPTLPQGNLLFSAAEGVLSQSGSIIQTAETAAAAMAAAAAGQPPPGAVAAAVQHLQQRALQVQQVASALTARAMAGGNDASMHVAAQVVQQAAVERANAALAPQLEPLAFQPPRHKVRAALKSSWAALQHNEKLQKMMEPYPLPAVARQAAAQAAGAIDAVEHVAEVSFEAVGHEEQRAFALGRHALQWGARELRDAASDVGGRMQAALPPQMRAWLPAPAEQQPHAAPTPAAAMATASDSPSKAAAAAGTAASSPLSNPARATAAASGAKGGKAAAEAAPDASSKPAAASASGKPTSGSTAISGEMFAGAVADLKEGYVGLWHSALEFDPHKAAASVHQRIQAGQQQAAAAAAAAANAKAAAGAQAAQPQAAAASSGQPAAVAASSSKASAASASSSSSKTGAAAAGSSSKVSTIASGSKAASSKGSATQGATATSTALPKKADKPAAPGGAAAVSGGVAAPAVAPAGATSTASTLSGAA